MAEELHGIQVKITSTEVKKIILVIGPTGTGKSTIINMLYNNDFTMDACTKPFEVGGSADSVTKRPQWILKQETGMCYGDTVGLCDPTQSDLAVAMDLKRFIGKLQGGIHCLIIVARCGRVSREERANLATINEIFDSRWVENCVLVLTYYEGGLEPEEQQECVKKWIGNDGEIGNFVKMGY